MTKCEDGLIREKMKLRLLFIVYFFSAIAFCSFSQTVNLGAYPQLNVWLRADSLITLNPDSTINSWTDIAGNVIFSPLSSTQSPKVQIDSVILNNHAYADFDGVNDGLLSASAVGLQNDLTTILLVAKINTPTFFGHLVCYGTNTAGSWNLREVNNSGRLSFINANANIGAGVDASGSNPAGTTTPLSLSSDYAMISGSVNPVTGQWDLYENFDNKHSVNVSFSQASNNLISIGYRTDAGLYGDFRLAELMIFDSVLSIEQMDDLKTYLRDRYSVKVNLGTDINIPYGFCDTMLDAGPEFNSYIWSTGDTTQTITTNRSGEYRVTVTDKYGLQSTDTINISFPGNLSLIDTVICPGSFFVWNTTLSHNAYSFLWQDASSDSLLTISSAGQHYIQITDSTGCSIISDTIDVSFDNFFSIASLGNDTSFCSGNYIYLQSGAPQISSYLWPDGSSNDSLQVFSSGLYWVTVTSITGCVKTDTIIITIAGNAPTPDFSTLSSTCVLASIQFADLSIPPAGDTVVSWSWDFGDSAFSALQNPSHVFADTGNYSVTLYVTTNEGCSAAITKQIHIYPFPAMNFTVSNLCEGGLTLFTGNATTFGYPIIQWNWNFADPASGAANISSVQNPGHVYTANAVYPVTIIATNSAGCSDTAINNVIIKQAPVVSFTSTLACRTEAVQFIDNTVLPPLTTLNTSFWNFGDSFTSSLLNPTHVYSSATTFNVIHIVAASNGCRDTIIIPVTVNPKPVADFSSADQCSDVFVSFTDNSVITGGGSIIGWTWLFGTSGSSTIQNPQHLFGSAGIYNVQLIINSDQGCKDTASQAVTVYPVPYSDFNFSPQYGNPPLLVNFTNTSAGATAYQWNFDDGTPVSSMADPSHIFNDTGYFQVSLIAFNSFGCSDTTINTVEVIPGIVDVEVSNFTTTILNNFLTVKAEFKNNGTSDVQTMTVYFKVNNSAWIREEWEGTLIRNGSVLYTFTSSVFIENTDHYVCVSTERPNGLDDDLPENNELCNTFDIDRFQVFFSYPDPVEDLITLPVFVPGSDNLDIVVYNDSGKKVEGIFSGSPGEGFYKFEFNTLKLASGIYIFRIRYKDQINVQKFIKK